MSGKLKLSRKLTSPTVRRIGKVNPATKFSPILLQTKLAVGSVNDPLEKEADRTAERVASGGMAQMALADATPATRREGQGGQPNLNDLEATPALPADHVEPTLNPNEQVKTEMLDPADMAEISSEPLQADRPATAPTGSVVGREGGFAPMDVTRRVMNPDQGRPLTGFMRAYMEARFGVSFAQVRVHDLPADRAAAIRIGARAFTHQEHIWLGPGENDNDKKLMAHELTHVVQQSKATLKSSVSNRALMREGLLDAAQSFLLDAAETVARNIPGYTLLEVILEKSPLTDKKVERTPENVLAGIIGLVPLGTALADQLRESGALKEAGEWVMGRLQTLNLSWTRIKAAVAEVLGNLSSPFATAERVFTPILKDILTFALEVGQKIKEFVISVALKAAGSFGPQIWGIVQNAQDSIQLILDDPGKFATNLIKAVGGGFTKFKDNIVEHLKKGLMGWLFGALGQAGIQMPAKLDLKGILSLGLQVIGLSWQNIRPKLVKQLNPQGEGKVKFAEGAVSVLTMLVTQGIGGIWQKLLGLIENFKGMVLDGLKDMVMSSVVNAGVTWLLSLTNPIGGIIKIVKSIYDMVTVFLERFEQIKQVAEALFGAIGNIARGNVTSAENLVEQTMARAIPVVISFIAGFLGLKDIPKRIKSVLDKIRRPVDKAVDKLIGFVVKKAKKLLAKMLKKLNSRRKLAEAKFKVGVGEHTLYAEKKGKGVRLMVASEPTPLEETKKLTAQENQKLKDPKAKKEAAQITGEVGEAEKEAGAAAKKVDPDVTTESQRKPNEKLEAEVKEAAQEISVAGADTATFEEIDTEVHSSPLYRAKEPRDKEVEGKFGTYQTRLDATKKKTSKSNAADSKFYDNDHIVEKQFPKIIVKKLNELKEEKNAARRDGEAQSEDGEAAPQKVGKITKETDVSGDASNFPAITVYHPIHLAKGGKGNKAVGKEIEAALDPKQADPIGTVKAIIAKQLEAEVGKVANLYKEDATAPQDLKSQVASELQQIVARNKEEYGLDEKAVAGAGKVAGNAAQGNSAAAGQGGLVPSGAAGNSGFTESATQPDFDKLEGEGNRYGAIRSGGKGFLESDHIIDKSYGLYLRDLNFNEAIGAEVDRRLTKLSTTDAKAAEDSGKKWNVAKGMNVFPSGSNILNYSENNGFAVRLYRQVHLRVNIDKDASVRVRKKIAERPNPSIGPMLKYLLENDEAGLDEQRGKLNPTLKSVMKSQYQNHADSILKNYDLEIANVAAVNAGNEKNAKKFMSSIVARVKESLIEGRKQTNALIP